MSCIKLRLPHAKKAWKSFTSKLQTELRMLNRSKAIKKPPSKYWSNTCYSTKAIQPPYILGDHKKRRRGFLHPSPSLLFRSRCSSIHFRFPKKPAPPVFIDKLFGEPVTTGLLSSECPPLSVKNSKILDSKATKMTPGTSKKGGEDAEKTCPADDMWESVGFASPQMHGIDERAEQFISSFRAEMVLQEIIARRF